MKSKKRNRKWQVKPPKRIHKRPGVTLRGISLDRSLGRLDVAGELHVLKTAGFSTYESEGKLFDSGATHVHD